MIIVFSAKVKIYFRFVDEDGQDYQPPYFPPPQFEQQGQYQFHTQSSNGEGQYTQQAIIMSEDQQMVEEGGAQGQNGQTRIIVGNSALSENGYIVTQEGLALQAVDGQQVIMMNEVN